MYECSIINNPSHVVLIHWRFALSLSTSCTVLNLFTINIYFGVALSLQLQFLNYKVRFGVGSSKKEIGK